MTYNCYITFASVHLAILAEDILNASPFSFKMVPVPRSISTSCGTAVRCACPDLNAIKAYLSERQCPVESGYKIGTEGLKIISTEELFK